MISSMVDAVIAGCSPVRLIAEKIDPAFIEKLKNLKPNDKLRVYHGTSKVWLPRMINGFDAAQQEMSRSYGGPRHKGLFVTSDIDVADRFSSYGELILDLEVRAKNLHGTDYSGNKWGSKEDKLYKNHFPNSFRPGLSYLMSASGAEPQALLLGLVGPKQIKRIRWSEKFRGPNKWYTRAELLKKGVTIKGEPGSGYGEYSLDDWGINLSSTKVTVEQLIKAISKQTGRDEGMVTSIIKAWAHHGEDEVHWKLRNNFRFGAAAAKALARKIVAHKF